VSWYLHKFSLYSNIITSWFIKVPENFENFENDLDPIEEPIDQIDINENLSDNQVFFEKVIYNVFTDFYFFNYRKIEKIEEAKKKGQSPDLGPKNVKIMAMFCHKKIYNQWMKMRIH
jgi:hypothetical protein